MQNQRSTFAALLCVVLSIAAVSQPAWAADSMLNGKAAHLVAAKAKLQSSRQGKSVRFGDLASRKIGKLNGVALKHTSGFLQQALSFASTTHGNDTSGLSDHISSFRSQFASESMKDAKGMLRLAASIRERPRPGDLARTADQQRPVGAHLGWRP
jgi:hypothetical protein